MKAHEVRRALANIPDNADVYVDEDSIRFVPETERAPPPTPSEVFCEAVTLAPPPLFDSTVCIEAPDAHPFELPETLAPPALPNLCAVRCARCGRIQTDCDSGQLGDCVDYRR